MINKLAKEVYDNAVSKGFYDEPVPMGVRIALIHSEASEMLEADRKDNYSEIGRRHINLMKEAPTDKDFEYLYEEMVKDSFEDELVDLVIRAMDLAHYKGIDLETHIALKMRYNSRRPHMHNKKY